MFYTRLLTEDASSKLSSTLQLQLKEALLREIPLYGLIWKLQYLIERMQIEFSSG